VVACSDPIKAFSTAELSGRPGDGIEREAIDHLQYTGNPFDWKFSEVLFHALLEGDGVAAHLTLPDVSSSPPSLCSSRLSCQRSPIGHEDPPGAARIRPRGG